MKVELFDFDLPEDRIALHPASPRDSAKMLVVGADGAMSDRIVTDLGGTLELVSSEVGACFELQLPTDPVPTPLLEADARAVPRAD